MVLKKHATATLLPVSQGSEVVVATTSNFHRILGVDFGDMVSIIEQKK